MNVLNPSNWNTESYDSKITSWVKTICSITALGQTLPRLEWYLITNDILFI
jgi:hypothetical protein